LLVVDVVAKTFPWKSKALSGAEGTFSAEFYMTWEFHRKSVEKFRGESFIAKKIEREINIPDFLYLFPR
jgi:hypothetical protein